MKTIKLLVAAALAFSGTAFAGERVATASKTYTPPETECFRAKELQLDLFGQYSVGEGPDRAGPLHDHGWGGGLGMNYFFTRNLGLGADAAWLAAGEPAYSSTSRPGRRAIHNFSGSLIYRFPMDRICTAPYLFGGGGFAVDGAQWATAHIGAGVEHRVIPGKLALFADARWTYFGDRFGREDLNNISARAGVRFVF